MSLYPEHEKLEKISDKSQAIGEFLEWLQGKYSLCKYYEKRYGGTWWPVNVDIQDLLAEFFQIDRQQIEFEKRLMVKRMQDKTVEIKTGKG